MPGALVLIDQLRDDINQLENISGLVEIRLRSGADPALPVRFISGRRIKEDRSRGIETANMATHLDSAAVRESAAQKIKIEALLTRQLQPVGDGCGGLDLVIRLTEQKTEQLSRIVVVFGAENALFRSLHSVFGCVHFERTGLLFGSGKLKQVPLRFSIALVD